MSILINASKIWSIFADEDTHYVRVKNNVANFTNRQILIRTVLPHPKKDGMYNIGVYGDLKEVELPIKSLMRYPDVDLMANYFADLRPLCTLNQEVRHHLLEVCRAIYNRSDTAIITVDRIQQRHPGSDRDPQIVFHYPFNVEPEIRINAKYLEIVLLTFKDYPMLHVGRHPGAGSPLIIGLDWGSCSFIAPN